MLQSVQVVAESKDRKDHAAADVWDVMQSKKTGYNHENVLLLPWFLPAIVTNSPLVANEFTRDVTSITWE